MSRGRRLATVDPLHNTTWSAKGSAGDAMQRVDHRDAFIAMWVKDGGEVCYSLANLNWRDLSVLHSAMGALLSEYEQAWLDKRQ